ncbi:MAG: aminoacetone oxidase family FAD-binding enzyme [Candidatus Edwardsbacteria bacterium]|nr:aminoacetone oxidase family FAD-binding enzyme [Candidatus Edwardsbacteria bacterium]
MMAAIAAASAGIRPLLLEKMPEPGRKLLLTGNGRCNLGNDLDPARFIGDCGPRARFLRNALHQFGGGDTVRFFAERGVTVQLENRHQYFPRRGGAAAVLEALLAELRRSGAEVRAAAAITGVRGGPGRFELLAGGEMLRCRSLVLATGGRSYPATGSDGSGHDLAASLGHAVTPVHPGNVPLRVTGGWTARLQGISLAECALAIGKGGAAPAFAGGLVFTHYGISGPAALAASRPLAPALERGPVAAALDLLPALSVQRLDRELVSRAARFGKKTIKGLVGMLLPDRLAGVVVDHLALPPAVPASQLTARQRAGLVRAIKRFPLTIEGTRGFGEAMVTIGGVDLRGVDPATMGSQRMTGLHFCGELLDLDGPCGGYNLQIAWTTGWVAGRSAARGLRP